MLSAEGGVSHVCVWGAKSIIKETCAVIQSKRLHKVLERAQKQWKKVLVAPPAL